LEAVAWPSSTSHAERIRNDQEGIELLMAVGLFLHTRYWAFSAASLPAKAA
jgi:hypothetical protein